MKHTLAHLVALLLAQFVTSHAATPGADKTKLDIIYKTTAQGPLRLDWTVNGDVEQGKLTLVAGTMIINGTFTSLYQGFAAIPSGARLGGNLTYYESDARFGYFQVNSGGIVAPGNPAVANGVGTITTSWGTNAANVATTTFKTGSIYEWQVGPANATDKVHVLRTTAGSNNNRTLIVEAGMVLKILDAGGTPLATDQLPVFTYNTGVVRTLSLGSVAFDTSDLVSKGWTIGTLALTDDGAGTIYLTGLSKSAGGYSGWAGGAAFTADANGDGVDNGLAWLLGALNPSANALGLLPVQVNDGTYLKLSFQRVNPLAPAKLYVEYGTDLSGWTRLEVPASSGTIGGDIVVVVTPGSPTDSVTVKIPTTHQSASGGLFARLAATEN